MDGIASVAIAGLIGAAPGTGGPAGMKLLACAMLVGLAIAVHARARVSPERVPVRRRRVNRARRRARRAGG